jgi:hypothetical protein
MHTSLQIFDATMRIGKARDHIPGSPYDAPSLLQVMDRNGINEALVWHADSQHYDALKGNEQLLEDIQDYPSLHPCWVFLPHEPCEMPPPSIVVNRMLTSGVKAARIFPREHLFLLRLWNIAPLLESLEMHKIPLFVDYGVKGWGDAYYDWDGLYQIGTAFPDLPIILTCVNIGSNRTLIPLMQHLPNLYVETSYYTVHRGIELLVSKLGAERILFGTGLPQRAPGPALTALAYCLISEGQRQLVAGDNLRRLLHQVKGDA